MADQVVCKSLSGVFDNLNKNIEKTKSKSEETIFAHAGPLISAIKNIIYRECAPSNGQHQYSTEK